MQLACEGFSFFQIANEDKLHSLPVSIAESFVINGTNKERRKKKRRSDVIEIIRKERKSNYTDWFLIHPLTITNQTSFLKKKEKKRKEKTKERKKKKRSRVEKGFSNSLRKKRRAISPASGIFSLTRFEGSHWHAKFAMATRPSCLLLSLSLSSSPSIHSLRRANRHHSSTLRHEASDLKEVWQATEDFSPLGQTKSSISLG